MRLSDGSAPTTTPRSRGVVVVGDVLTDVLVVHEDALAIGSDTAASISVAGGGQGANTAAWLAYAGCAVTLVAAVGDDAAGRDRIAELAARGVRCAVRTQAGAGTGSVVVLASARERTMFTDRGAALLLDPADVSPAVAEADAGHLHLSGYPLLDDASRPAGLAALAAARERGLTTSVDAASAAPLRRAGSAFREWVRGVDLLLCNADEAGVLAGPGAVIEQARALTAFAPNVVIKQGAAGALWCDADGVLHVGPTGSGQSPPGDVIDPTGAGDAFAAGLLAAWCAGADPAAAVSAGAMLGATAVSRIGARPA
ncbi:MAG TPA: sugar kinase [Actinoplanes sp.]